MNSRSHFVALCTDFVITITQSSSDTALVSFVMICFTTVATVSLLDELGACTDRPVF
jgi:hypothetical protein